MKQDWLYEGKPFAPDYEEIDPEYVGFVYQITDTETGQIYSRRDFRGKRS